MLKRSLPNLEKVAIQTKNGLHKTHATSATALGQLGNSYSLVPEGDMFLLSVVKVMLAPGAAASLSFALGFFYKLKLWHFYDSLKHINILLLKEYIIFNFSLRLLELENMAQSRKRT